MKRTCKRRKAFLGAIIGAVTGIAGSAISAASQRKAQEKQIKRENYINRNQSANNLSAVYSNEEYVDDFLNKTTFKYGGNKTMACGNRKTAEMGISERYKKQLEQREKDRKAANAIAEQKRREANARGLSAQKERATYMTKLDAEAKNRQETKKRLSARNTKPFPYVSTIAEQKGLKYYAGIYATNPFINNIERTRIAINDISARKPSNRPSTSSARTTTTTKRPVSPVTQTRTAVKRNTNTTNTANRNITRQTTTTKPNAPVKTSTTTNGPAQRTTQRSANTSTQRPAKPITQNTNKPVNAKTTTNKATTTKTAVQPARQNADNKLTFSRTFANARKAGKQTFNWNGKSYTTQLAGEKKNNTNERTYKTATLDTRNVDAAETTKLLINTKTNTIPSASSVIPKSNTLNIADNNGYYDRIKMMKCGGKRKMKCGGKCKKK